MQTRKITAPALFALSTALALAAPGARADAPIHVVLNGTPLAFAHTPPMQIKGSTLVPMRDIFEALGATVKFDKASQTVFGQKGATAIILPLGALTATVNGQPHSLPQAAQLINGTTLVPLRFISEALGAAVLWHPENSTVTIQTVDQHVASLPATPGSGNVSGEVTGVYTNTTPTQMTVRVGGRNTVVPLSPATIILRSVAGQPGTQVALSEIKPGDQVLVERADGGTASVITATFGEVRGTVVSIGKLPGGDSVVTLDSGKVIEVAPDAPVTFGGRTVSLSDIKPYEKITVRTNPQNSLGYGVAVETAATPDPTPPGQAPPDPNSVNALSGVSVNSLTTDAIKPLKAGDTLTATLGGSPGGKASFSIPGVAENIAMRETSAGIYQGTYTVPRGTAINGATVLGKVVVGGVSSVLIQAPGLVTIDSQPPKITDFGPARDSVVESDHPLIYATLSDGAGVGVNPAATRVSVDGRDETAQAAVAGPLFTLRPADPLPSGVHTVTLAFADKAGNAGTATWSFKTSTSKIVQSFTTNEPPGQTVGAGATIVFTLTAQPGGKGTVSLGTLAKSLPLSETDPGTYVAEYTVKAGDSVQNAPVAARFVARDGTEVTTSLPAGLTVAAGPPPAPRILAPKDGDTADGNQPLAVTGRAAPGSTVRVALDYVSKVLGGILPVSGSAGSKDVVADKNGEWTVTGFSLKTQSIFGAGRDTVFTVTATQLDAGGNPASDAAKIQVRPG